MNLRYPQLFVRINKEGGDFFIPSTLSRPSSLDELLEPNTSSFTIPVFALNNEFETDEDVLQAYRESLLREDDFEVIIPHFFQRDVDLKLEGELPRRIIQLPNRRILSCEEFNNIIFNYLRGYSNLAKKWAQNSMFESNGYELDFRVTDEVLFDTDSDYISYSKSRRIDDAFPYFQVSCGLRYYSRKEN